MASDEPARNPVVFISHAPAEREWVENFLRPALGEHLTLTPQTFRPGAARVTQIEEAVRNSRYTLVVLSPAYLSDDDSLFSELLATHIDLARHGDRLVPVLKERCEIPAHIDYRVRLDCTVESNWEGEVARLRELLAQPEPAREEIRCPFPGMVPFRREDAPYFFGRDREIEEILQRLRHQRFLVVIGPSGSGKSSLLSAGVLPQLDQSGEWTIRETRPSRLASVVDDLPSPSRRLLLVVDQFEEVFADIAAEDRRRVFDAVHELRNSGKCALILAVRSDYYGDLQASPLGAPADCERIDIVPLREESLSRAITGPAAKAGVALEARLLERLLADAQDEPGVLPLIQETMCLLWPKRMRRLLTLEAYRELGGEGRCGLATAVARKADATLADLSPPRRDIARRIFLRLIQPGQGRPDTRRQQPLSALQSAADDPGEFKATLDHLTQNRLLTQAGQEQGAEPAVDISHETLITGWPTLQGWIGGFREAEETRRRLETKAGEWQRLGGGPGGLLDEVEMEEAQRYLASREAAQLGFSAALRDLVLASRRAIERKGREERRAKRSLKRSLTAIGVVLGIAFWAVVAAWLLYKEWKRTEITTIAQRLAQEATRQLSDAHDQDERAALLARQAYLINQRYNGPWLGVVDEALRRVLGAEYFTVRFPSRAVAVSPSGRWLAEALGKQVRIRDLERRLARPVELDVGTEIDALVFTPDEQRLVIGGERTPLQVWDWRRRAVLSRHGESSYPMAVDGSAAKVATAGADGAIRLWDLDRPDAGPAILQGHKHDVLSLAFRPDGRTLASIGIDGSVRFWDLTRPAPSSRILANHKSFTGGAVAFGPDGRAFALTLDEKTVRVRDLRRPDAPDKDYSLEGVAELAFSSDSQLLAAGLYGAWLIDLHRPDAAPLRLFQRSAWPRQTGFSRDGRLALAGPNLVHLRLPLALPGKLRLGQRGEVGLALTPDGRMLAAVNLLGAELRVWDLRPTQGTSAPAEVLLASLPGAAVCPLAGGTFAVAAPDALYLVDSVRPYRMRRMPLPHRLVAFACSGDGRKMATAGSEVRVWDPEKLDGGGVRLQLPERKAGDVASLAFDKGARRLAAGIPGIGVLWWKFDSPGSPAQQLNLGCGPRVLALSPDGYWLACAAEDGSIRTKLVDLAEGRPTELRGHEDQVAALAYSADGRWLASGGSDSSVRVWDLQHPSHAPIVLRGHNGWVTSVVFRPDGQTLISAGLDGTVRIWDLRTDQLAEEVCRKVMRNLTEEEWKRFVGEDLPYEETCPVPPSQ